MAKNSSDMLARLMGKKSPLVSMRKALRAWISGKHQAKSHARLLKLAHCWDKKNCEVVDQDRRNIMHDAAAAGDDEFFSDKYFRRVSNHPAIRDGLKPFETTDVFGFTPLHYAALNGQIGVVKAILELIQETGHLPASGGKLVNMTVRDILKYRLDVLVKGHQEKIDVYEFDDDLDKLVDEVDRLQKKYHVVCSTELPDRVALDALNDYVFKLNRYNAVKIGYGEYYDKTTFPPVPLGTVSNKCLLAWFSRPPSAELSQPSSQSKLTSAC
ncbi:MAG: hypothetical protein CMF39_03110 [Legionellaceae bacterium]|nr:hypothetical protein [Legionellaceae bacterium]|tara:strand:+ start:366 stop:1175 length:810 start_codon:yes stop_codon:yes gene_type:complete